mmetsp:Transcript_30663/g.78317  ORF Transcript_30663/g.78317 Transcript_30663/m.78317 type:complete len:91 (+) Transcript_30663:76-348(+)
MRRLHRLGAILTTLTLSWALVLAVSGVSQAGQFLWQSPLAALVTVAVYLLARLVHGILTFNSRPDEAKALQKEVAMAQQELAKRGLWPPS